MNAPLFPEGERLVLASNSIELARLDGERGSWAPDELRVPHVRLTCFEGEARLSPSDCRALAKRLEALAAELDKGMHHG